MKDNGTVITNFRLLFVCIELDKQGNWTWWLNL
jgi:hypothetical protein